MIKLNTKKEIVIKKFKNKKVEQKAKLIGDFVGNGNKFDRDLSAFYNYKGKTYVLQNPKNDDLDDDYEMQLDSNVQVDEDLKKRYFAGLSEQDKEMIEDIKFEYGL